MPNDEASKDDEKNELLTVMDDDDQQEKGCNRLSSWMTELPASIRLLPLTHLTIPGSHDSGAYDLKLWSKIRWDSFLQTKKWLQLIPFISKPLVRRWAQTQKVDIRQQLENGIRYFDMRVATKSSNGDFFFVHGLYGPKILKMCSDINCFLDEHPCEVVILHFQHFYNVKCDRQRHLLNELLALFTNKICPYHRPHREWSLHNLRLQRHQVIIFFPECTPIQSPLLWPNDFLPNPWPNTTCTKKMISFLEDNLSSRPQNTLFVTQGVLTPNYRLSRRKLISSLQRSLSIPANRMIYEWLSERKAGSTGPGVVMTDFVDWKNFAIPRRVVSLNYAYQLASKSTIEGCGNSLPPPTKPCQVCESLCVSLPISLVE